MQNEVRRDHHRRIGAATARGLQRGRGGRVALEGPGAELGAAVGVREIEDEITTRLEIARAHAQAQGFPIARTLEAIVLHARLSRDNDAFFRHVTSGLEFHRARRARLAGDDGAQRDRA